jgi:hypothetical protein
MKYEFEDLEEYFEYLRKIIGLNEDEIYILRFRNHYFPKK